MGSRQDAARNKYRVRSGAPSVLSGAVRKGSWLNSGVSTAIIIFTKTGTGGTDRVWFYDMRADGFSLTTQRTPTPEQNDIPDIIARFGNLEAETDRSRKDQSFFVTADEIRSNDYDLSYKRYHEVERTPVHYDAPEVIIARIEERQAKINAAFEEFKKLLNS